MTFLAGVIEGFYGQPWTWPQRFIFLEELHQLKLNTYLYAPKFDVNHRVKWRVPYSSQMHQHFSEFCSRGKNLDIQVILSLSPGLSIDPSETSILLKRFKELAATGTSGLALLMDDIPYDRVDAEYQIRLARVLSEKIPDVQWFFCPTVYSRWHLNTWEDATAYLEHIGNFLPENWEIFWTGNTVISKSIESSDLSDINEFLKRKPLLWDNYSADDYVPAGTFFPGPLTGRSRSLCSVTSGLLLNPSEIYTSSALNVHSLASWLHNPDNYCPLKAFSDSIQWITARTSNMVSVDHSILEDLLGYFYTPFELHPTWRNRLNRFSDFVKSPSNNANPQNEFEQLRNCLRDEDNIIRFGEIWIELYPFVRSLLGDLDYIISACKKTLIGERPESVLPDREARWSSPLNDTLSFLR